MRARRSRSASRTRDYVTGRRSACSAAAVSRRVTSSSGSPHPANNRSKASKLVMTQRVFERVRRVELALGVEPSHYEPGSKQ